MNAFTCLAVIVCAILAFVAVMVLNTGDLCWAWLLLILPFMSAGRSTNDKSKGD